MSTGILVREVCPMAEARLPKAVTVDGARRPDTTSDDLSYATSFAGVIYNICSVENGPVLHFLYIIWTRSIVEY